MPLDEWWVLATSPHVGRAVVGRIEDMPLPEVVRALLLDEAVTEATRYADAAARNRRAAEEARRGR